MIWFKVTTSKEIPKILSIISNTWSMINKRTKIFSCKFYEMLSAKNRMLGFENLIGRICSILKLSVHSYFDNKMDVDCFSYHCYRH